MNNEIYITKATGEKELFDESKLINSLERSGADTNTAKKVLDHIKTELTDGMSTKEIYRHAFEVLSREEKPVALKYSLRRAIMDMGPTGFPFEKLIAEIFRTKGFEVTTEFTAQGECVEHEIDVTAWNEEKLIMIEAKFHNELGMKSDLKTVLYVNSRWLDLKDKEFDMDKISPTSQKLRGIKKMDEGWLITNTKFSTQAVKYAKCRNMKLVGWNYPREGNLQDMILESGLHPITVLESISHKEKANLMEAGIILCKQALDNQDIVLQSGIDKEKIQKMAEEINLIQSTK